MSFFIGPVATGKGDGSSRDNAAPVSAINAAIAQVGPGGSVRLLPGDYHVPTTRITNSGTAGKPVRITSADPDNPAVLVGSRNTGAGSTPYVLPPPDATPDAFRSVRAGTVWGGTGNNLFNLNDVAFLQFDHLHFKQFAQLFAFHGDTHDIAFADLYGFNCQDYFYGRGYAVGAGAYNITIQRCRFEGYSKSCVSPAGSCHHWLVEDVYADSGYQVSDQFAMGFFTSDAAHDITYRRCTSIRNLDYQSGDDTNFWNGDGFTTERGTKNLRFEDCYSGFNSDGGFDSKSEGAVFLRCVSEHNKENYKLWASSTLQSCMSKTPAKAAMPQHGKEGGTGGACDLQAVGGANIDDPTIIALIGCTGFNSIQKPVHAPATTWIGRIDVS